VNAANSVPLRVLKRRARLRTKAQEQLIYDAIKAAAVSNQMCPANKTIAMRIKVTETTVARLMRRLVQSGRIGFSIIRGRRVAELDTGEKTKEPGPVIEPVRTEHRTKISCLSCSKPFWSWDRTKNRRCSACKEHTDYLPDVAVNL
jgi:hypothetical protein